MGKLHFLTLMGMATGTVVSVSEDRVQMGMGRASMGLARLD